MRLPAVCSEYLDEKSLNSILLEASEAAATLLYIFQACLDA
jgi:hypothetical protein